MYRAIRSARCSPSRHASRAVPPEAKVALRVLPVALSLAICAFQASAQTAPASGEVKANTLDTMVVLGTRRSDVTALTSAQPLDVVSAEQLQATGATTVSQALQRSVPSFHFPQETPSTSVQYAVRGASLHGMSPDQVLVLVNGIRYHRNSQLNTGYLGYGRGSQIVDIDSIPVSAIERIEVLRDGASAQYGSDAVAGVVNIVLKKGQGGGVSTTLGQYTKGDGFRRELEVDHGFGLPNDGSLHIAAVSGKTDASDIAVDDTRQMYFAGDPRESVIDRHWFYGNGEVTKHGLLLNGEMPLGESVTLFATGVAGYRKNMGFANFRRPMEDTNVRAIYPNGFQPIQEIVSTDQDFVVGVRIRDPEGWGNFDISAQTGRNRSDIATWNTLNTSLGVNSPTGGSSGGTVNVDINLAVDHVRYFTPGFLPGGLTIGSGLAYRHEEYEIIAGDPMTWIDGGVRILDGPRAGAAAQAGSQGASGFRPGDAGTSSRHVVGGYVGAATTLFDRLDTEVSLRYEDYSDFGSTTNGKLSLRYEISQGLALRGSFSTGYRAPSIAQLDYARTTGIFVDGVQQIQRILPASSAAATALGATPLEPEQSKNLSLGLVWQPSSRSVFTLDAYDIKVDDRIVLTGTLSGRFVSGILAAAGFGDLYGAQFFTNALDTRTKGFDAVYKQQVALGRGSLDLMASYSRNRTEITHIDPNPPVLSGSGITLIDRQQRALIEHQTPEDKLVLSGTYSNGPWSLTSSAVQYGRYSFFHATNPALDQEFGKQWTVQLSGTYRISERASFTLGANNLLDSHPDKQLPGARNPVVSEYSNLAPEGANGTWLYAKFDYRF